MAPDEQDRMAQTRSAFVAALGRGDAKAASCAYAEGARLLPPAADVITGRDAIEAFWQAGIDAGVRHADLFTTEIEVVDGLAYEIGRYSLRLDGTEAGTIVDQGKYVLVHEREDDGSWRWVVEMFSPDPGDGARPTRDIPDAPNRPSDRKWQPVSEGGTT